MITTNGFSYKHVCNTCASATKENFYLYMRRTGNVFAFPDFLHVPGDPGPVKVVVNDRPFTIPGNQRNVLMAENALALIFLFSFHGNNHTLGHVKSTGCEVLYTRPGLGSQIKGRLAKGGIDREIVLQKPSITPATAAPRESGQQAEDKPTTSPQGQDAPPRLLARAPRPPLLQAEKLFKASIRINLDMLQRVLKLGNEEFNTWIIEKVSENGLFIESSNVIVEKTDVPKFLKYIEAFLSKR